MSEMFESEDLEGLLDGKKPKKSARASTKVSKPSTGLTLVEAKLLVAELEGAEEKEYKFKKGETRTLTIQKGKGKGEGRAVPVTVQGRTYLVPRGVKVKVPAMVAEVLEHAEETFHDWDASSLETDVRTAQAYPVSVHAG